MGAARTTGSFEIVSITLVNGKPRMKWTSVSGATCAIEDSDNGETRLEVEDSILSAGATTGFLDAAPPADSLAFPYKVERR